VIGTDANYRRLVRGKNEVRGSIPSATIRSLRPSPLTTVGKEVFGSRAIGA
jgi:hypothetical protein